MFFGCTSDVVRRYFECFSDEYGGTSDVVPEVFRMFFGGTSDVVPDVPDEYGHSTDVFRMSG